jgi:hypothetical protein
MKINMERLYFIWIRLKYQYYKLYWKVKPPKKFRVNFYGWHEGPCYNLLDQKAVCYGIIKRTDV